MAHTRCWDRGKEGSTSAGEVPSSLCNYPSQHPLALPPQLGRPPLLQPWYARRLGVVRGHAGQGHARRPAGVLAWGEHVLAQPVHQGRRSTAFPRGACTPSGVYLVVLHINVWGKSVGFEFFFFRRQRCFLQPTPRMLFFAGAPAAHICLLCTHTHTVQLPGHSHS